MAASSESSSAGVVLADVRTESGAGALPPLEPAQKTEAAERSESSRPKDAPKPADDDGTAPLQSMDSFRARLKAARREPPPDTSEKKKKGDAKNDDAAQTLQSMDSFRVRLKASRREPVQAAQNSQWETRGHFWEALEVTKDPSRKERGVGSALKVKLKSTAAVIRKRPSVLLWPLLLFGVCLTAGLIGVALGSRHEKELSKDDARAAASQAAFALGMSLEESLQPLRTLEMHVQLKPAMQQLGPRFQNIAQQLVLEAPPVVSTMLLAPFGVVRAVFATAGDSTGLMGSQLVTPDKLKASQLESIVLQQYSGRLLAAHKPVLIAGAAADETWGNDGSTSAEWAAVETPDGSRLWGVASSVVDVSSTAGGQEAPLQSLQEMGYLYRALLLDDVTGAVLAELNSSPPLPASANPVVATAPARGAAAMWQVEVAPKDGWTPSWEAAMTAVVVVVSVFLGVMLFAALVIRDRHMLLLEAMLPGKVIAVLDTGRNFFEHYDNVTVLYADIVRYSNAPRGMPGWEVVKMLNEVNHIYDSLLDKHGLIKIRRSGEAFMAVGGCPVAEDPVATAVRVAICAREMVLATAAFKSSAGQRVQIRLGLHSGPAVAAVLGTVMPRFSLLGDMVDIAHFMESTSTIMGVHVSDTTAELLNIADDPLISLQPRGIIDIKGRGPITTFWLRIDLFAAQATFTDRPTMNSTVGLPPTNGAAGGGGGGAGRIGEEDETEGGDGNRAGGSAAPKASAADIACTADLAVAAQLGVRGAPLVRKLSQTGLTQTRRALPDRHVRRPLPYDNSILGSFTMRLQGDTVSLFGALQARPSGEFVKLLDLGGRGGKGGASGGGAAVVAAASAGALASPPAAAAGVELAGISPKISAAGAALTVGTTDDESLGTADEADGASASAARNASSVTAGAGTDAEDQTGGDEGRRRATTQIQELDAHVDAADQPPAPAAVAALPPAVAAAAASPAAVVSTAAPAGRSEVPLAGAGLAPTGLVGVNSHRPLVSATSSGLAAAAHLEIEEAED